MSFAIATVIALSLPILLIGDFAIVRYSRLAPAAAHLPCSSATTFRAGLATLGLLRP